MNVPESRPLDGLEAKWGPAWEDAGTNRFHGSSSRDQVFAIDTPPPTATGSLHIGHVLSYTHTDLMARNKRMRGFDVAPCCRADRRCLKTLHKSSKMLRDWADSSGIATASFWSAER